MFSVNYDGRKRKNGLAAFIADGVMDGDKRLTKDELIKAAEYLGYGTMRRVGDHIFSITHDQGGSAVLRISHAR